MAGARFGTSMRLNPLYRRAGPYLGIGMAPFFKPALRGGRRRDATFVATRYSQLGPYLSISCVTLRAYGSARRSARYGWAAARDNDRGGPECRALAEPRAPRAVPVRFALGGRRGDMSQKPPSRRHPRRLPPCHSMRSSLLIGRWSKGDSNWWSHLVRRVVPRPQNAPMRQRALHVDR